MDFDFETLLYLAFGILYFVFTSGKKKKKTPPKRETEGSQRQPTSSKPAPSFEDLLKEFTGDRGDEEEVLEPAPERDVRPQEKPKPISESKPKTRPITEQTFDREKERTRHSLMKSPVMNFEEYEEQESGTHEIVEDFYEEDGARKAFIYSEIFNRKF